MSLYGKSRRTSALNLRRDGTKNTSLSGLKSAPIKMSQPYPERQITFKTAKSTNSNFQKVLDALDYISSDTPIFGTELLSINNGSIAPIFLGKPGEPDPQYLYDKPENYDPLKFFTELKDDCQDVFLFAHLQSNRKNIDGIGNTAQELEGLIPYSTDGVVPSPQSGKSVIFVDQRGIGGRSPVIRLKGLEVNVESCGNGTSLVGGSREVDTWYGGNWDDFSDEYGVGKGSTKEGYEPGDRLKWSFGTVYFFRGIGPGGVLKEVSYEDDGSPSQIDFSCDDIKIEQLVIQNTPAVTENRNFYLEPYSGNKKVLQTSFSNGVEITDSNPKVITLRFNSTTENTSSYLDFSNINTSTTDKVEIFTWGGGGDPLTQFISGSDFEVKVAAGGGGGFSRYVVNLQDIGIEGNRILRFEVGSNDTSSGAWSVDGNGDLRFRIWSTSGQDGYLGVSSLPSGGVGGEGFIEYNVSDVGTIVNSICADNFFTTEMNGITGTGETGESVYIIQPEVALIKGWSVFGGDAASSRFARLYEDGGFGGTRQGSSTTAGGAGGSFRSVSAPFSGSFVTSSVISGSDFTNALNTSESVGKRGGFAVRFTSTELSVDPTSIIKNYTGVYQTIEQTLPVASEKIVVEEASVVTVDVSSKNCVYSIPLSGTYQLPQYANSGIPGISDSTSGVIQQAGEEIIWADDFEGYTNLQLSYNGWGVHTDGLPPHPSFGGSISGGGLSNENQLWNAVDSDINRTVDVADVTSGWLFFEFNKNSNRKTGFVNNIDTGIEFGINWDVDSKPDSNLFPYLGEGLGEHSLFEYENCLPYHIVDGIKYDYSNPDEIKLSSFWYSAASATSSASECFPCESPSGAYDLYYDTTKKYEGPGLNSKPSSDPDVYGRAHFTFLFKAIEGGDCIDVRDDGEKLIIDWAPEKNWELCSFASSESPDVEIPDTSSSPEICNCDNFDFFDYSNTTFISPDQSAAIWEQDFNIPASGGLSLGYNGPLYWESCITIKTSDWLNIKNWADSICDIKEVYLLSSITTQKCLQAEDTQVVENILYRKGRTDWSFLDATFVNSTVESLSGSFSNWEPNFSQTTVDSLVETVSSSLVLSLSSEVYLPKFVSDDIFELLKEEVNEEEYESYTNIWKDGIPSEVAEFVYDQLVLKINQELVNNNLPCSFEPYETCPGIIRIIENIGEESDIFQNGISTEHKLYYLTTQSLSGCVSITGSDIVTQGFEVSDQSINNICEGVNVGGIDVCVSQYECICDPTSGGQTVNSVVSSEVTAGPIEINVYCIQSASSLPSGCYNDPISPYIEARICNYDNTIDYNSGDTNSSIRISSDRSGLSIGSTPIPVSTVPCVSGVEIDLTYPSFILDISGNPEGVYFETGIIHETSGTDITGDVTLRWCLVSEKDQNVYGLDTYEVFYQVGNCSGGP